MEEEIHLFRSYIPPNLNQLEGRCSSDIKDISRELILRHRQVILLNLYQDDRYPTYFPSEKTDFYDFIDKKPENNDINSTISPERKQIMANLYQYFLNHPSDLVSLTVTASHFSDYKSLAFFNYSTIPSIFGFFSSYEHIAFGYHFYCQLLQKVPHSLFFEVVLPFFENATTYRFIEAVAEHVIEFFCQDLRILKNDHLQQILEEHSDTLHETIVKFLPLLPKAHLNLFILMRNNKYSASEIHKFIVLEFVKPCVSEYLKSSAYSGHVKLFQQLCEVLANTTERSEIEDLFKSHALIDVPSMFADFGLNSIEIAVTPLDTSLLLTLITASDLMPKFSEEIQEFGQIETPNYIPIWIQIYAQKQLHPIASIGGNVIFRNSMIEIKHYNIPRFECLFKSVNEIVGDPFDHLDKEEKNIKGDVEIDLSALCEDCRRNAMEGSSERCEECKKLNCNVSFEQFVTEETYEQEWKRSDKLERILEKRVCLDILERWGNVVKTCENMLLSAHYERIIDDYFDHLGDDAVRDLHEKPSVFIEKISHLLNNEKDRLLYLTARAEYLMDTVVNDTVKEGLNIIEEHWADIMDSADPIQLPPIFRSAEISPEKRILINKRFVSIAASINTVTLQPFTKRFFHILECLRDLDELSSLLHTDSLLPNALRICHGPGVVSSMLKCIGLLMKKSEFVALLPKCDAELWYGLEAELLKLMQYDETASVTYTRLVDQLIASL